MTEPMLATHGAPSRGNLPPLLDFAHERDRVVDRNLLRELERPHDLLLQDRIDAANAAGGKEERDNSDIDQPRSKTWSNGRNERATYPNMMARRLSFIDGYWRDL